MNILVVDDELVQLESLNRGLRSKGCRVLKALSAREALDLLDNDADSIDMIITDYAMPLMNGLQLLDDVRKNHGDLEVIMMTAYGCKDLVIEALHHQCSGFIEKPFTLDQLMQEIERVQAKLLRNTNLRQLHLLVPKLVHQINNPLTCISGSAELAMLALNKREDLKEYLGNIIKSVKDISKIHKELIDAGRWDRAAVEKVDLHTLLEECLALFRDVLTLKGICVERRVSGPDLYLWGNRFGLEQMLKNLILNAIDSMDGRDRKHLEVSAARDDDSSSIWISIEDSGCGISEELMEKIFAPYFTAKKHGTGLGLAVVRDIVESHRGGIQVRNRAGGGTTVTVNLPSIDPAQGRVERDLNGRRWNNRDKTC
jgi:signal transduction histidine kinase